MKTIEVVAAVITHNDKIFATQRGYGEFKDGWEFPGGKHCFLCTIKSGNLVLKEHEAAKWLTKKELGSVDWLPADLELIHKLEILMERI